MKRRAKERPKSNEGGELRRGGVSQSVRGLRRRVTLMAEFGPLLSEVLARSPRKLPAKISSSRLKLHDEASFFA